jgi:toxin ParE1/3/4
MARIVWTREALENIELIRAYIQQFDPQGRAMLGAQIDRRRRQRDFPERGRPTSDGRRELPIVSPYIIRYRVDGDRVFGLRIRGRQE